MEHLIGLRSFAAACCYTLFYLLMMPAARLVCQRPSSNFPYFRTPLANFLLSRPNSVEYGNSKTTTLLPSAKCTRPLFQGRTGCGGRPSGWHDIVTCQRLVINLFQSELSQKRIQYLNDNAAKVVTINLIINLIITVVILINSIQIDNVAVKYPVKFVQNSIKNLTKNVRI